MLENTVPIDLKRLSDAVHNEVALTSKFNTLMIKVNDFETRIPDETTLIHITQCSNCFEYKNWWSWK